ncbi:MULTISPECIES: DUF4244 domain-containing protein [unclassified Crossiella]|uniref:DUF4244 domain-containing protein n=1 Tax=unclassified Crossiella TaxID=2620835 RepID=UPI001FFF57DA|nr:MULTISPECIES: DUF4244 domain-containing protein [unclassified Crossiella]MCK2237674.1 DUF4244 domain-containing protein [Crossiella sp. S99.2]MCK2254960.1 DUF4244 domain-containing protein [Crossiella sp. S99.1]
MRSEFLLPPNAFARFRHSDDGTITVEYAIVIMVCAAVGGALLTFVTGGWLSEWITDMFQDSLEVKR